MDWLGLARSFVVGAEGVGRRADERRRRAGRVRRRRPGLESLEDRRLLAMINEFPLPTSQIHPISITDGPDGNLWFTEQGAVNGATLTTPSKIGTISPTTHAVNEFTLPSTNSQPLGITAGPDGNLWFTETILNLTGTGANQALVGTINPRSHAISEFPIASNTTSPSGITAGPDGNLWFAHGAEIGTINPSTHAISEFAIPNPGTGTLDSGTITLGPDHNLWFGLLLNTGSAFKGYLAELNPSTHAFTEFAIPSGDVPSSVTTGPDGNLWLTETVIAITSSDYGSSKIGTFNTTTHAFAEFTVPTSDSLANAITTGPDGNLWFTESDGHKVGTINPTTHAFAEFALPTTASFPQSITTGPDGNLWFVESQVGKIGQVVTPLSATGITSVTHSKLKQITTIVVGFNEGLNSTAAQNKAFYTLAARVKKRGGFVFQKTVPLRTATYDATAHTVTLKLTKPTRGPLQLTAGTSIASANGAFNPGFTTVVS